MRPWIRSLWNIWPKRPLRDDFLTFEISKNMFPGIFFGFDICNLKLFAMKHRLSIVPSLQHIQIKQLFTIRMSNDMFWMFWRLGTMLERFFKAKSFRFHISKPKKIPVNIFFDISRVRKSSRRGLLDKIFDKLRIQGCMQIFGKKSQKDLNHVLIG